MKKTKKSMQFKVTSILLALFGCSMLANGSPIINQFAEQLNLGASLQTLYPIVGELQDRLDRVSLCYEPELVGQNVNIFDREASIQSIVDKYYQAFPHKKITAQSISNLIGSISDIMNSCLNSDSNSIRYGLTELSDMSNAQMQALTGLQAPSFNKTVGQVTWFDGSDNECRRSGASIPSSFDWRNHGAVTSVKNQGQCGSCWTFATAASIEGAYLVNKKTNDPNINLSEQQILDCSKSNGCSGGNSMTAFEYVKTHGITSESNYPYEEQDNGCDNQRYQAAATISDYCVRSLFNYATDYQAESLSDRDIQEALVNYGPLYIILNANPAWSQNYRGGVVTGGCTTQTNHAVLLVGYTEEAWIVKNSWGASWGANGYFQMVRGQNMCGINTEIAFPLV